MAPNMPRPTMNMIALPAANTRSLKRRSGSSGSGARASCSANSASRTTPAIPRPMIVVESQPYSIPPQLATSKSEVTPATISAAPI